MISDLRPRGTRSLRRLSFLAALSLLAAACTAAAPTAAPATQPPATLAPTAAPVTTPAPATEGPTAAPATPAATPAANFPDAQFKVGVVGDFTGQAGIYGQPAKNSALLAIQDVNAAGGIWGQPIAFAFGEAASNPQQGLSESQRLVNVEHAQVLMATTGSGVCLAIKQGVTVPDKILTFGTNCISPAHTQDQTNKEGFFFRVRPPVGGLMGPIAKLIADDGHKNVCVMYVDNAYGQSGNESFKEIFSALVPDASIQSQGIPDAVATTYLSELQTCTADGHDIVATPSYGEGQADVYMKEGIENGLVKRFYFTEDQESTAIFEKDGWDAFDTMQGASGSGLPGPNRDQFLAAYTALYGSAPDIPLTEMSYDGVVIAALAAAKANSDVSSDIRDNVYDVTNAPGEKIGSGPEEIKKALDLIAAGQDIDYVGVTDSIEYDDSGQNLIGGARIWHVDAANKTLPTDYFLKFNATDNTFEKIEAP
ncbi:MAG: branched-chain amino acid transport system substrate-binding protein [Chloroflexota bacterium]|nr:branched-chain amino acid transport system substrate-binding protein [Chloroflexota bacterium]